MTYTFSVKAVGAKGTFDESMEAEKSCTTKKTITSDTSDSFVKQIGDLKTAVSDVKAECTRGIQGLT